MNIFNFVLWLILVALAGYGVGRFSARYNKFVSLFIIGLYLILISYLAHVLNPLGII